MTIVNRFARLLKADIHGILDSVEDPETLLKQSVREMQEDVAVDEQRMKVLENREKRLTQLNADCDQVIIEMKRRIELTFTESAESSSISPSHTGREGLVKQSIRRKLETEQRKRLIIKRLETTCIERSDLETVLSDKRGKLDAVIKKIEIYLDRTKLLETEPETWTVEGTSAEVITDSDIELEYLREMNARKTNLKS